MPRPPPLPKKIPIFPSSRHSPVKADPRGLPQTSWWLADCTTPEIKLDTLTCQFGSPRKLKIAILGPNDHFLYFSHSFSCPRHCPARRFLCFSTHLIRQSLFQRIESLSSLQTNQTILLKLANQMTILKDASVPDGHSLWPWHGS